MKDRKTLMEIYETESEDDALAVMATGGRLQAALALYDALAAAPRPAVDDVVAWCAGEGSWGDGVAAAVRHAWDTSRPAATTGQG